MLASGYVMTQAAFQGTLSLAIVVAMSLGS